MYNFDNFLDPFVNFNLLSVIIEFQLIYIEFERQPQEIISFFFTSSLETLSRKIKYILFNEFEKVFSKYIGTNWENPVMENKENEKK